MKYLANADNFPNHVYEALSTTLNRSQNELRILMQYLIDEWKNQAREILEQHGYKSN